MGRWHARHSAADALRRQADRVDRAAALPCLALQVREGELATAEGVSYLEAKHLLLLHYCTAIVFYLLLKAEGRPVQSHPVINRLVEARAYLVRRAGAGRGPGRGAGGGVWEHISQAGKDPAGALSALPALVRVPRSPRTGTQALVMTVRQGAVV